MMKSVEKSIPDSKVSQNGWIRHLGLYLRCCDLQKIRRGATCQAVNDDCFTQVTATLGRECRVVTKESVSLDIELLIEENGLSAYLIVYTDGSVQRGVKTIWGYRRDCQRGIRFCTVGNLIYMSIEWKSRPSPRCLIWSGFKL